MEWLGKLTPEQAFNLFLLIGAAACAGLVFIVYKLITKNGKAVEKPLDLSAKVQVQENTSRIAALTALLNALQSDVKEIKTTTDRLNREVGVTLERLDRVVGAASKKMNGG